LDLQRQCKYKQTIKELHRFASSQKDHILTQKLMTTYINMDSAIAGAMNARN